MTEFILEYFINKYTDQKTNMYLSFLRPDLTLWIQRLNPTKNF